ncbi:MAG: oligosaccharide flippase family protein [Planctomycetota bacterium]
MEESVLAREASTSTPRPRRTAAAERALSARAQARSLGQLLGSQFVVSACGLASLPILARNLGPEAYGRFSVFVLALGVLSNLDVARPILVREMSRTDGGGTGRDETATSLAATSGWLLAALSLGLGWVLGGPLVGGVLAAATFLHALTAAPFARLSAAGRVGVAGAVRNGFWALALVVVVALSFTTTAPHAWVWAFLGANALILITLLRVAPPSDPAGAPTVRAPRASALAGFRSWSTDVLLFALAAAVVTSCDKLLLQASAGEASFGRYAAQYDLAIKINILSTALSSVLYPALSRLHADRGDAAASAHFLRMSGRIAACYFVGIAALIALHEPILRLVLGASFAAGDELQVYTLMLVGVFVHLFGFLITPLQRARGDFRTHRSVYVVSATLMVVVGLAAIPAYGPAGAVAAYLTARTAEVALVAYELRRAAPGPLRTRSIAGFVGMLGTLIALAALALGGSFDGVLSTATGGGR